MLDLVDGQGAQDGASYVDPAELLKRAGAAPSTDLEQLWRRVVFSICVSNTDDHLRNHGFLVEPQGWCLAPAYDMNPDPHGSGLKLNVSETDNAQDLELALSVAPTFRVKAPRAREIVDQVITAVREWRAVASAHGLRGSAQDRMKHAFRVAEAGLGKARKGSGPR